MIVKVESKTRGATLTQIHYAQAQIFDKFRLKHVKNSATGKG